MTVRILVGDARRRLRDLPDESVHMVMTSPPYWGLRAYGHDPDMIGLEDSFDEHLDALVHVFRELWRVLRFDGSAWLNYGDRHWPGGPNRFGWKTKDLMDMPGLVSAALMRNGWYRRQEIIYHKSNPIPNSAPDRPGNATEKVYQLTKRSRGYFYDQFAVRNTTSPHPQHDPGDGPAPQRTRSPPHPYLPGCEPLIGPPPPRSERDTAASARSHARTPKDHDGRTARLGRAPGWRKRSEPPRHTKYDSGHRGHDHHPRASHNLRNVWTLTTGTGFSGDHHAVFPTTLCDIPIKAATSEKGVCSACAAPWIRTVEKSSFGKERTRSRAGLGTRQRRETHDLPPVDGHFHEGVLYTSTGWHPTCACDAPVAPAIVLDPFAGAGTVALAAERLQRDSILVEINPTYADMARRRIEDDAPMLADVRLEDRVTPLPNREASTSTRATTAPVVAERTTRDTP